MKGRSERALIVKWIHTEQSLASLLFLQAFYLTALFTEYPLNFTSADGFTLCKPDSASPLTFLPFIPLPLEPLFSYCFLL
jgi:hypothetical protein